VFTDAKPTRQPTLVKAKNNNLGSCSVFVHTVLWFFSKKSPKKTPHKNTSEREQKRSGNTIRCPRYTPRKRRLLQLPLLLKSLGIRRALFSSLFLFHFTSFSFSRGWISFLNNKTEKRSLVFLSHHHHHHHHHHIYIINASSQHHAKTTGRSNSRSRLSKERESCSTQ
jgi:ABC-type nickel/cobalt efflux system permease component RcnA